MTWEGKDYFALIVRDYLHHGKARTEKVGDIPARLFDAVGLTGFARTWMMETTFISK